MKKWPVLILLCAVFLSGCARSSAAPEPTAEPTPEPTPAVTEEPSVTIGGLRLDGRTAAVDLAELGEDKNEALRALIDGRTILSSLEKIDLAGHIPPHELYRELCEAYPRVQIDLVLRLGDEEVSEDVQTLDLHWMSPDQTDELLTVLPYLTQLEEISFVSEKGACAYSLDDIPQLDRIREAAPSVHLKVAFDLFGKRVTSEDERIEYYLKHIGNEGVDTVRAVLPYLSSCTYLLMDGCDIDNEVMAQLREDFPVPKIVWRVWLIKPYYSSKKMMRMGSFLTDTERVRTTLVRPKNCSVLQYCNETKYVDFGHNFHMHGNDYWFLAHMPKLEACIICISHITDLTPLASCPELEYLEVFTTDITSVEPLANCKKLAYLNIANCKKLTDITPLYDLTSLKVLRMVVTPKVPKEQKKELARRLPNCRILDQGGDPTGFGWRTMKRYSLLRKQMKYDEDWNLYGIH